MIFHAKFKAAFKKRRPKMAFGYRIKLGKTEDEGLDYVPRPKLPRMTLLGLGSPSALIVCFQCKTCGRNKSKPLDPRTCKFIAKRNRVILTYKMAKNIALEIFAHRLQ